jgi:hypothetical protein
MTSHENESTVKVFTKEETEALKKDPKIPISATMDDATF